MFRDNIVSTPLTTDAANAYFQNIYGECYGTDSTFVATLRALVAPRIKDGENIRVRFTNSRYTTSEVNGSPVEGVVRAVCSSCQLVDVSGMINIHSFKSSSENNLASFHAIKSRFCSVFPGYHRLDKVEAFYQKSFLVDCYINPELKNVIVFVDNLDLRKLHYLQAAILAFLPWYFDKEKGVTELEMALLQSLRETSSTKYIECIAKFAEQYDFKTARIRQLLSGFENKFEQLECQKVRNYIREIDRNINSLNDQIGDMISKKNENCIRLLGLERKIAEGSENDSEIMEYFMCNSKLYLDDVTNSDMYFSVKDYLSYFDREMAERAINNERSFVYPYSNHLGMDKENMKKLMTELFVNEEPRLRIKFCAAYRFDLNGNVRAQSHHTYSYEFYDCMPNTHIDRFSCMGNYSRTINQLLLNRDYIGAIEQCVASCKSLNFGDSTVMRDFMQSMWGETDYGNNRCIELPDGRIVKPVEAVKWLNQQEGNDVGKEEEE